MDSISILKALRENILKNIINTDIRPFTMGTNYGSQLAVEEINKILETLENPIKLSTFADFKKNIGKVVTFSDKVEETESDFDSGMKARIKTVALDDPEVFVVYFDFSEFLEHNRKFMKDIYYDSTGNPCLTWEETIWFPKNHITEEYFDVDRDNSVYFSTVE